MNIMNPHKMKDYIDNTRHLLPIGILELTDGVGYKSYFKIRNSFGFLRDIMDHIRDGYGTH